MNYDEEIAGLKKDIGDLKGVVEALMQSWGLQVDLNEIRGKLFRSITKFTYLVQAEIESKASREEMRRVISEISKNMQLQEGTIKEVEGFKLREQG